MHRDLLLLRGTTLGCDGWSTLGLAWSDPEGTFARVVTCPGPSACFMCLFGQDGDKEGGGGEKKSKSHPVGAGPRAEEPLVASCS